MHHYVGVVSFNCIYFFLDSCFLSLFYGAHFDFILVHGLRSSGNFSGCMILLYGLLFVPCVLCTVLEAKFLRQPHVLKNFLGYVRTCYLLNFLSNKFSFVAVEFLGD